MKHVYLKKLIIRNFKGIRDLTIDFKDKETLIGGRNATGKTTVFDAFTWLLFGKDSTGRSDSGVGSFNIKTLGEDGNPILNEEHVVTGVLDIDGREVVLERSFLEKWGSGVNAGQLKSHYTEYKLNTVKLATKKEYDAIVSEILPEDVFRMVTNPFYFPTLPAVSQKNMLMDMAGNVTDNDIASLKPEFLELMSQISGRSLEQFKKEIASKKRAIQDELKELPARIDTATQMMPAAENWAEIETQLSAKKSLLTNIDDQISDKSNQVKSAYDEKSKIQKAIGEKRLKRSEIESKISELVNKNNSDARIEISNLESKVKVIESNISKKSDRIFDIDSDVVKLNKELEVLRGEYRLINSRQLEYPAGAFACPTCKRQLEAEYIEVKQNEFQSNFNLSKSKELQNNKSKGVAKAAQVEALQKEREVLLAETSQLEHELENLNGQIQYKKEQLPAAQDPKMLIQADQNWINLGNEITELENQLTVETPPVDTTELQSKKRELSDLIDSLNKRLAKRETIENAQRLIQEYEDKKLSNNEALAQLEQTEYIILDFQKTKDNELMKRINGMFSIASFSFVDEQLNGNEKITCVCLVDGVPFPDLNNAMKINAGLDIINAICNSKGITAPIFIDNREGVNELIPTVSQTIGLMVTEHRELTIKLPECTIDEFKETAKTN